MGRSAESLKRRREYCRERYYWYKEHGICVVCGKTWAEPGRARCGKCSERMNMLKRIRDPDGRRNAEYLAKLRQQRKDAGQCVDCGKTTGGGYCPACAKKHRERMQKVRIIARIEREAREARDRSRQKGDGGNG